MRAFPVFAMLFVTASAFAQPPGASHPVTPARAAPPPAPVLAPIDAESVPAACHATAVRAQSAAGGIAQEARVSLAMCIAQERTREVVVCDCEQSLKDLDDAAAPAFTLLADLAAKGDPGWQVVALHADGELLEKLADRVLQSVPALPPTATEDETSLHQVRVQLLQPLVQPALDQARDRFVQADRVASQHPELAKNPMVANAAADSRRRLAH